MPAVATVASVSPPTEPRRRAPADAHSEHATRAPATRWTKARRLRRPREFARVYEEGRKIHGTHFVCFARRTSADGVRVGITVGRKVGNAVTRNRVRRRIRAGVRQCFPTIPAGTELVFVARDTAAHADYAALHADMQHCLQRLARRTSA